MALFEKDPLYENLALAGGGVKGIAHVGAAEVLDKVGILKDIDKIAGTSAGAIGALLLATGWSVEKIKEKFMALDLMHMVFVAPAVTEKKSLVQTALDGMASVISNIPFIGTYFQKAEEASEAVINFKDKFGMFEAAGLSQFFKDIFKEVIGNENGTLEDWHNFKEANPHLGMKDIYVEALNVNTGENEVFSHESDNKKVPGWQAIRASMAFPFALTPVIINGHFFSDGGEQNNCPASVFDKNGDSNPKTLSSWLAPTQELDAIKNERPHANKIETHIQYIEGLLDGYRKKQTFDWVSDPIHHDACMYLDTLDISTLDFGLNEANKERLIASGRKNAMLYLQAKHPGLAEKHYTAAEIAQILGTQPAVVAANEPLAAPAPSLLTSFEEKVIGKRGASATATADVPAAADPDAAAASKNKRKARQ